MILVGENVESSVGTLAYVPDAFATVHQQMFLRDHFSADQLKADQPLCCKCAKEQIAPPFREDGSIVKGQPGGRHRRCPEINRLFHAGRSQLACPEEMALIVESVADGGESIIAPPTHPVELVLASRD